LDFFVFFFFFFFLSLFGLLDRLDDGTADSVMFSVTVPGLDESASRGIDR